MDKQLLNFHKNALLGSISGEPLCNDYVNRWRRCGDDKEMLVGLVMQQQSIPFFSHACYKRLGLTKKYILDNFGDYINGNRTLEDLDGVKGYTYQLYVAFENDFEAVADVTSLMWCSSPQIEIEASKCPLFYVSNNSDVHFLLNGYNSIRIYLFDDSKVTIDDADEDSKVVIYKYSDKAQVELGKYCLADVKVFDKELRL